LFCLWSFIFPLDVHVGYLEETEAIMKAKEAVVDGIIVQGCEQGGK
jgi:hypothetical protein